MRVLLVFSVIMAFLVVVVVEVRFAERVDKRLRGFTLFVGKQVVDSLS